MKTIKQLVSVFLLVALAPYVSSATEQAETKQPTLTAEEIVSRASLASYYAGADGSAEARMKIVDAQGRRQLRQFSMLRRNVEPGGDQDLMVFFSRPSDVRGTVYRVIKHPGNDDDRWLYLPGLDLVKRISAGDKRTYFVGSDFFYEDVSGRDPKADSHQLIATTPELFQLRSTPKDSKSVEFVEYTSWIDRKTFLPVKVEYTDARGKVYRRMEVIKTEVFQGYPVATEVKISRVTRGTYTLMQMRRVRFDIGLPQDIFSERSLRNPPTKWLKAK
ncbi:outer membrane lipoprotein-sorting protein [Spongorhabdus nitratireducens]